MELLAAKHDFNGNYCSLFFVQDLAYCSLFFVQDLRMFLLQGVCITNGEKQKARAKGVNLRENAKGTLKDTLCPERSVGFIGLRCNMREGRVLLKRTRGDIYGVCEVK